MLTKPHAKDKYILHLICEENHKSVKKRIETLFTTLGAETAKQQKTTREKAERFLSFWTKVGFIKEFRRRKAKGRKTITGWEIIK